MNRILWLVSGLLFVLLLLVCGYLYREQGRLDALQQAVNDTSPIMMEELEELFCFITRNSKME